MEISNERIGAYYKTCSYYLHDIKPASLLVNQKAFLAANLAVVEKSGLHIASGLEPILYPYPGQGLTVIVPLQESHLVAASWPEYSELFLELSSCSPKTDFQMISRILEQEFNPGQMYFGTNPLGDVLRSLKRVVVGS